MTFEELLKRKGRENFDSDQTILCLDPGHTTGVALFKTSALHSCEQVSTIVEDKKGHRLLWTHLDDLFERTQPDVVVCEDYRVYQQKLESHAFSPVLTLRLIGAIDYICHTKGIPITYQMATTAKGFCTDKKLQDWDYWQSGLKHSRDAIRHGCYYLLFHK